MHTEVKAFICSVCGTAVTSKSGMKMHMWRVHDIGPGKSYPCTECDNTFKDASDLRLHVNAYHKGNSFKCETCNKKFVYEHSMKRHVKTAHPPPGTVFTCVCGETFKKYWGLNIHERKKCKLIKSKTEIKKESAKINIDCIPSGVGGNSVIREIIVKAPEENV